MRYEFRVPGFQFSVENAGLSLVRVLFQSPVSFVATPFAKGDVLRTSDFGLPTSDFFNP
jgi:hypothetical protein